MATTQLRSPASTIEATYRNLSTAELYEHAIRNAEGIVSAHGSLVVRTGKHTGRSPQDKFVVRERSSAGKVWWGAGQPADQRGALRPASCPADEVHRRSADLQPGPLHRCASRSPSLAARDHRDRLGQHLRPQSLPRPTHRRSCRLRAELPDHRHPVVQGRPGHRGHPQRDGDPGPSQADGDHHRRDRVRRRDQEVGVHGHELPASRRRRPADALVGQRRSRRRPGALLRPLRHGQDDALRGPGAEPHRRRRAWLGTRRALQLRGRLLREDDPPLADVRARHLRHHAPLRDDPRERRSRRGDSRARPRLRSATPRTRAAPTRWSSSATRIPPA